MNSMMQPRFKIGGLLAALVLLLASCDPYPKYHDFPMQVFKEYMPVKKGDVLVYECDNTDYTFEVQRVQEIYQEGSPTSYDREYAAYVVEAMHPNSTSDTVRLTVGLYAYGRTRIRVEYEKHHTGLSISNKGVYNYANRSDLLFKDFPQDTLLLKPTETDDVVAVMINHKGLASFVDGKLTYTLK